LNHTNKLFLLIVLKRTGPASSTETGGWCNPNISF